MAYERRLPSVGRLRSSTVNWNRLPYWEVPGQKGRSQRTTSISVCRPGWWWRLLQELQTWPSMNRRTNLSVTTSLSAGGSIHRVWVLGFCESPINYLFLFCVSDVGIGMLLNKRTAQASNTTVRHSHQNKATLSVSSIPRRPWSSLLS